MRRSVAIAVVLLAWGVAPAQAPSRYNIDADLDTYPQKTPKEALASVLKAIDNGKIDYLLAQLTEPLWVDNRVKLLGGDFRSAVRETRARLGDDPAAVKELRRFLADGQWDETDEAAVVRLKDVKNRAVFLRRVKDRWYFENRQKPAAEK